MEEQQVEQQPIEQKKSKAWIWILIILILIGIGVGAYFLFIGGSGTESFLGGNSIPSPPALPS